MKDRTAVVILAAGLGTRFKSNLPKVLHAAGGRTLIDHVVRAVTPLAARATFAVIGHQAGLVEQALRQGGHGHVHLILQKQQLGTGHALSVGEKQLRPAADTLIVVSGDTPLLTTATLRSLLAFHRRQKAAATVLTAVLPDPAAYGRILRASDGTLAGIVELKAASEEQKKIPEINTGIYCFQVPELFAALKKVKKNPASGEYYLTDVIELLRLAGRRLAACPAADRDEITGINDRAELARVDSILRLRKANELMLAGVSIHSPHTVRIDPEVAVGADTTIEAGVYLNGRTVIGSGCVIGAYSVITDSTVADSVTIRTSSVIAESNIERGAMVGPFAHLRPGAQIGEGAHIGDFVEVKKSKIGRRSKANHLAYIGDATVGEDVNIGAGTITVNYDGVNKHQTLIADRAFIGSGSELIAPVEIGEGAFVAAGSTIHDHVPAGALAIARARQAVKPGWMLERTRKLQQAKSASKKK